MGQVVTEVVDVTGFRPSTQAEQGVYSAPSTRAYSVGDLTHANGWVPLGGKKSCDIIFTSTAANNASKSASIEVASPVGGFSLERGVSKQVNGAQYVTGIIATLALTVGATAGSSATGAVIGGSERFIDTIVPTITALGTYLQSKFGTALTTLSPQVDLIGQVGIRDLGNATHIRVVAGDSKAYISLDT